jgi:hypothetical protein
MMNRKDSSLSCSFRLTSTRQNPLVVSAAVREAASRHVNRVLPRARPQPAGGKQPRPERAPTGV